MYQKIELFINFQDTNLTLSIILDIISLPGELQNKIAKPADLVEPWWKMFGWFTRNFSSSNFECLLQKL